jgi:5'(3')-deoxyribonucleotidase
VVRIAFDVDGVLRDLLSAYVPYINRRVEELEAYDDAVKFAGGIEQFYGVLDRAHCWRDASAHVAFYNLYREIQTRGHETILITANPSAVGRMETMQWLHAKDILYDELHFCPNKLLVAFDAIVEDHPETAYMAACAGRAAFLPLRPWTAKTSFRHHNLFKLPEDVEAHAIVLDVLDSRGWQRL